jgi:hypothetical protein
VQFHHQWRQVGKRQHRADILQVVVVHRLIQEELLRRVAQAAEEMEALAVLRMTV